MATGDKNIWIEMVNQVELEMASRCIGFEAECMDPTDLEQKEL